jgi:hypothetical protein
MAILHGDGQIDGNELALQLAARLREIVPPPLSVAAKDGFLLLLQEELHVRGGVPQDDFSSRAVGSIADQRGDWVENVCAACSVALEAVQDHVIEYVKIPWPFVAWRGRGGPQPPEPFVNLENDTLTVGYHSPGSALLQLPLIPLR